MSATLTFYERLQAATIQERQLLRQAPLIRAALAGALAREDYRAFLTQAYHHVRHTVPLLMACGARLAPEYEWLRVKMAHYIEEEIGHQEWILDDIRHSGGDADAVRDARPLPATELMVAYAYDQIARVHPLGFLGMVFVLEGTSIELASAAAEAIQRSLNLPKRAFSYLTSHGALDLEHVDFFRDLVNQIDNEADRDIVLHAAKMFFSLYSNIFYSIPLQRAAA